MKVRRRHLAVAVVVGIVLCVGVKLWVDYVPEPKYQGIGLGLYLVKPKTTAEQTRARREGREAVRALGASAVPYLVSQIERDPLRELWAKAVRRMPNKLAVMLPDPITSLERRARAAAFLPEAGTNAVGALPRLLEIAEAQSPNYMHNLIRAIGMLAPGSEYEDRGRRLILRVVNEARSDRDLGLRFMCYDFLGTFGGEEVFPALIEGLKDPWLDPRRDPWMADRYIEVLVRLGTNAIPQLQKAAEGETGQYRLATVAVERLRAGR